MAPITSPACEMMLRREEKLPKLSLYFQQILVADAAGLM